ncbi:hypothetical protein BDR04DRAFT_516771 [Suillus decipiens]|nr:hypothetical protein BDR04DRAFT_516771 [Suillus decipiens]
MIFVIVLEIVNVLNRLDIFSLLTVIVELSAAAFPPGQELGMWGSGLGIWYLLLPEPFCVLLAVVSGSPSSLCHIPLPPFLSTPKFTLRILDEDDTAVLNAPEELEVLLQTAVLCASCNGNTDMTSKPEAVFVHAQSSIRMETSWTTPTTSKYKQCVRILAHVMLDRTSPLGPTGRFDLTAPVH